MIHDPRRAGQVTRYHVKPRLRDQNNAEHSWHVARIVLAIYPGAPRSLIVEALFHDIGEIGSGDAPYPVKKDWPAYGLEHNKVEAQTRLAMCIPWSVPPEQPLTDRERAVLKTADYLEMWEWALQELNLGNTYAHETLENCQGEITRYSSYLGREIDENVRKYMRKRRGVEDATLETSSARG